MARLINKTHDANQDVPRGAASLFINGIRYANAAAKFWSTLIDEVHADFPNCSLIELATSSAGNLCQDLLYPQRALEKDICRLAECDFEDAMNDAMAEMELLGPPSSVHIRLLRGQDELFDGELPIECVDAEIFPYLVVWPLAWAGISATAWNSEFITGDIEAEDRRRRIVYLISLQLTTTHISEGLYRRSLAINPSVTDVK